MTDTAVQYWVVGWFKNDLKGHCAKFVVHLNPLLLTLFVNSQGFYTYDTIIYCCGGTLAQSLEEWRSAFCIVESELPDLQLVLNAQKLN